MAGGDFDIEGVGQTVVAGAGPAHGSASVTERPRGDLGKGLGRRREVPWGGSSPGELVPLAQADVLVKRGVDFEIDETTGRLVTKVVDRETDEVIRQIPPEEMLRVARWLRAHVGAFFDREA